MKALSVKKGFLLIENNLKFHLSGIIFIGYF
jgi:hypothetical protein